MSEEYIIGNLSDNKPKDRCEHYQFSENAKAGEHEYCSKKQTYSFECKCPFYSKEAK